MSPASDKSKLLMAIEACRPGSDDIDWPEMAEAAEAIAADEAFEQLYGRIQQSDTAIANAFRDVPPPAGLLERLLADLDADVTAEAAAEAHDGQPIVTPRSSKPARRFYIAGVLAACAVIAAGVGFMFWNQPSPVTGDQIVAAAVLLHTEISPDAWRTAEAAPADRPTFDRFQRDVMDGGWTNVDTLGDNRAVAYHYARPRGTRATLLVFRPAAIDSNLPLAPPLNPSHSSGVTVGTWTSNGLVYALVVDGGVEQYQGFLRSSSVAMHSPSWEATTRHGWVMRPSSPHILRTPHNA